MSRLDQHVGAVQRRMTLSIWLWALAWALLIYAALIWIDILIGRIVQLHLPRPAIWFWTGLGITVVASFIYTMWRRPTKRQAAIAIDQKLALKEKFSTALYIRPSTDPFAMAAVRDAEKTADSVSLQRRFPVKVPLALVPTALMLLVVFLTAWLLPTFDLFGVQARRVASAQVSEQHQAEARESVRRALIEINEAPKAIADKPEIQLARRDLEQMRGKPTLDPDRARSTAQKAIQDVQQAIKEKIKQSQDYAVTQEEMKDFKDLAPPADQQGDLPDARRAASQGKFDVAADKLANAVKKFDQMKKEDQQKTADQAKDLAKALQKMANDPKVQQQVQQQLQKMGANQQQVQQMQKLMQNAAAGDKQAQQQIAQAAKQLAQQANQTGRVSPQQQRQMAQQMQQQMQQMQQKINAQVNAQQMAQSAQALAQAMQQAAQQGGNPGQPKQGQNGQAQGQKPGGNGQQMANAAQQMQQQLQQMQAIANDAQQVAAAQQQNAGGQNGNQPGPAGQKNGQGQQQANGAQGGGKWQPGNNQQKGQGFGAGGIAAGARPAGEVAPFSVKDEVDPSQRDEKGKVLASTFVKAGSIKGDAKMELHQVIPSVDKDATDEVDEQRIPRQDAPEVRDYFSNLKKDSE